MAKFTREEILAELERRNASTSGAATRTAPSPQGPSAAPAAPQATPYELTSDPLATWAPGEQAGLQDSVRSVLRGATGGLSDALGSGVAALAATAGPGKDIRDFPEVYGDIRGAVQHEAELVSSPTQDMLEGAGAVSTLFASGLPQAAARGTGRLLGAAAPKVAGATKQGLAGATGRAKATTSKLKRKPKKPEYVMKDGKWTLKDSPTTGRSSALKEGAKQGAALDVAQAALGGEDAIDYLPGATAGGAAIGALTKASPLANAGRMAWQLGVNNPVGRMAMSRMGAKALGSKFAPWIYAGMHPQSRKVLNEAIEEMRGK